MSFSKILVLFITIACILLFIAIINSARHMEHLNHGGSELLRRTVEAEVVAKRAAQSAASDYRTTTPEGYYITFRVEGEGPVELPVSAAQYGHMVEGDRGRLTFQGTQYLSFQLG